MEIHSLGGKVEQSWAKVNSSGEILYITYDFLDKYDGIAALTTLRMQAVDCLKSNSPTVLLDKLGPGLASILQVPPKNFIAADQVHSSNIFVVGNSFIERLGSPDYVVLSSVDGFVTDIKKIPLLVFTADCLPVFAYDTTRHVAGLAHAGRRGTEIGVAKALVRQLVRVYGSDTGDIVALIGASIGPCCYPVDLWSENARQLEQEDVGEIANSRICTGCNTDKFYSYRIEKGIFGRMVSVIMLK